ncbi:hypothetical protein JCM8547_001630 [Rhodosporidiobolus lusitaniae]
MRKETPQKVLPRFSSATTARGRRRFPSPSPSNYADRKAELQKIIRQEQEQQGQPAPLEPVDLTRPRFLRSQISSSWLPRCCSACLCTLSPSLARRLFLRTLLGVSRSSVDSQESWWVGLNSNGEVDLLHRSARNEAKKLDKGKGRAPPTPERGDTDGEETMEEEGRKMIKGEPSSTPVRWPRGGAPEPRDSRPVEALKPTSSQPFATGSGLQSLPLDDLNGLDALSRPSEGALFSPPRPSASSSDHFHRSSTKRKAHSPNNSPPPSSFKAGTLSQDPSASTSTSSQPAFPPASAGGSTHSLLSLHPSSTASGNSSTAAGPSA